MRIVFLALVIGLCASGCRPRKLTPPPHTGIIPPKDTLVEGTVIQGQGTWNHSESGIFASLTVSSHDKAVVWNFYTARQATPGSDGSGNNIRGSIDLASPASPWFIYVESPDRLWLCDGNAKLSYQIWTSSKNHGADAILDGALKDGSEPVPAEVIPLLPADLQKLFPAAKGKPRPSI